MALIKCKKCGIKVSNKAERCPFCGYIIKRKVNNAASGCLAIFIIMAGIILMLYGIGTMVGLRLEIK